MSKESLANEVGNNLDTSPEIVEKIMTELERATGGTEHAILVEEGGGWTIRHPLSERWDGSLFNCDVTTNPLALLGAPLEPGEYTISITPSGAYEYAKAAER